MTNVSLLERAAQRRVRGFEHKYSDRHGETYGKNLLYLSCHAALPAALSTDLVHLLRINFFFESAEQLPYTAEADLLLSPLCTEIGDELYEMDREVRDILLQKLTDKYGRERLSEVAMLLWQYDQRFAPWADRDMLERAQQLTALSFLDPAQARQWLTQQSIDHNALEQRVWFTAVSKEVLLAEKLLPLPTEQVKPVDAEVQEANAGEDQTQSTPAERVGRSSIAVPSPDVSQVSEDQQPTMAEESELASASYSSQEFPAGLSSASTKVSSEERQQFANMDRSRLYEVIVQLFSPEELRLLCIDLTEILHHDGINMSISLDMLEGRTLREKVRSLIGYCERRDSLEALIRVVLLARPDQARELLETEQEALSNTRSSTSEEELVPGDKEGHISRELFNKLVSLLLQVPGMEDFATRSTLLEGISNRLALSRYQTNRYTDISGLVSQLAEIRLQDGQSALLVFIDNVLLRLEGTVNGEQLKELRYQLEEFYERKTPSSFQEPLEVFSSQTKTNASEEKETVSRDKHMQSQPENDPDRMLKLEVCRKIIESIVNELHTTLSRKFTINALIAYEKQMSEVLEIIIKMPSSEIYTYIPSREAVLDYLSQALDELGLAIVQREAKGVNKEFAAHLRSYRLRLEAALDLWKD